LPARVSLRRREMRVKALRHVRNDGARRFNSPPSTRLYRFSRPNEIGGFVRYWRRTLFAQAATCRPARRQIALTIFRAWRIAESWGFVSSGGKPTQKIKRADQLKTVKLPRSRKVYTRSWASRRTPTSRQSSARIAGSFSAFIPTWARRPTPSIFMRSTKLTRF